MISIASDHGGYALKQEILKYLTSKGINFKDNGSFNEEAVDYPPLAREVAYDILHKKADKGILICGTGIGMSMAANRIPGIRAAVCTDVFSATATRQHNDANILCLGGRVVGPGVAISIVEAFLKTEFSNGERHIRRVAGIEEK